MNREFPTEQSEKHLDYFQDYSKKYLGSHERNLCFMERQLEHFDRMEAMERERLLLTRSILAAISQLRYK